MTANTETPPSCATSLALLVIGVLGALIFPGSCHHVRRRPVPPAGPVEVREQQPSPFRLPEWRSVPGIKHDLEA